MDEDDQIMQFGISVQSYRQQVEDTYLQVYLMLEQIDEANKAAGFLNMMREYAKKGTAQSLESLMFTLQSIELAMKDDFTPQCKDFMMFINSILMGQSDSLVFDPKHARLRKTFCLTMNELSGVYEEMPEYVSHVLRSLVQIGETSEPSYMQNSYVAAISQLCSHNAKAMSDYDFAQVESHLTNRVAQLDKVNVYKLSESLTEIAASKLM